MTDSVKRIDVDDLKVGMYIHDLNCDWMSHPFLRRRFKVENEADIRKIADSGIHEVYIDTAKGLDVAHAPTAREVNRELENQMRAIASEAAPPTPIRVESGVELKRARRVHQEANHIIHNMLQDVRLGKQVDLELVAPSVQKITDSILSNGGALLSLCRIKDKDNYTFQHSVSVGALMVSFCNALGMDRETVIMAGIGGMLHDTGKMLVPDAILNKPGRLTEEEFAQMKCHVVESQNILERTAGISKLSIQVAVQHHERHDGSGYPAGLKGEEISEMGQMAAIVDVYDALTSDRCYHKGMSPTDALRKIYEWSKFHFNPALVQAFMRTIGIYPVGTLVLLKSGRLAVVVEQNEKSLVAPQVKVFFSSKSNTYITPELIDLSRSQDAIVSHESPANWKVDPLRFM
jgi:HD-GYP domain-containing protein (c-di-GMP phosphodiesterase class II)